jgi:hypothetical protein
MRWIAASHRERRRHFLFEQQESSARENDGFLYLVSFCRRRIIDTRNGPQSAFQIEARTELWKLIPPASFVITPRIHFPMMRIAEQQCRIFI